MRTLPRLILALLLSAALLRADPTLAAARLAQRMLGATTWSRVIRIENEGRLRHYPRVVHALVFELADLLWFYTASDGTQSLSLHLGQLAAEKADFGPLLCDIEPGFHRWTVVADEPDAALPGSGRLPNGCFIESLCALRERVATGVRVLHPRLLSYYFDPQTRRAGHTVLMFETWEGLRIIDPSRGGRVERLPAGVREDPLAAARLLEGKQVTRARVLPLESDLPTRLAGAIPGPSAGPRQGA